MSGTALAQESIFQGASDSYSAGFVECQRTSGHPDKHGTPELARKSEELRAWKPANTPARAQTARATTLPASMSANEGNSPKDDGLRPGGSPAGSK